MIDHYKQDIDNRLYLTYDGAFYVLVCGRTASHINLDPDMWAELLKAKAKIDDLRKKNILESGEDKI